MCYFLANNGDTLCLLVMVRFLVGKFLPYIHPKEKQSHVRRVLALETLIGSQKVQFVDILIQYLTIIPLFRGHLIHKFLIVIVALSNAK